MAQLALPIAELETRHPGLTRAVASTFYEAACVCLERHHNSPVTFSVFSGGAFIDALVEWAIPDARCKAAHANEIKATEEGAYACALAAVEITQGLIAIHQAETRSGADYYLGEPGNSVYDLEGSRRLEVSGVDHGNASAVDSRLRQKIDQALAGRSNLPALAGVVGFGAKLIKLQKAERI